MILENNTQVVLAIDLISWVRLAEETYICSQPLGDYYDWIEIQQGQINELSNLLKQNHPNYVKSRLVQLMSQSLYLKEKTELLLKQNITSTDSY